MKTSIVRLVVFLVLGLVVVPLLLGLIASVQEHAPTAAQCQADLAVWDNAQERSEYNFAETAHIKYGTPNKTDTNKLSIKELTNRVIETGACMDLDPPHFEAYARVNSFYSSVRDDRYASFLHRHDLMKRVYAEDASGLR